MHSNYDPSLFDGKDMDNLEDLYKILITLAPTQTLDVIAKNNASIAAGARESRGRMQNTKASTY
jgi:hypothetical protein